MLSSPRMNREMSARMSAPKYPPVWLKLLNWFETNNVRVSVRPTMLPETMLTAPNSPSTRAVVSVMP
jgi:hypothetical protein